MFETIQAAPPDPILGLTEAFKKDANPDKINLGVGVYQDATGTTPVLGCVKEAERRLVDREASKSYLGIDGDAEYGDRVRNMMFGDDDPYAGRAVTLQVPGGTGALRVAADFIHAMYPQARIWCSQPTWANHQNVFSAAAVSTESYPYFHAAENRLDIDSMLAALSTIPSGEVVLLHACCHNPCGIDPTADQWQQIAQVVAERGLLPLIDFAYQGFGIGLDEDAVGLRQLLATGTDALICSSFSKNFGLYRERVGALTAVAGTGEAAANTLSQLKKCVRANYSNPPAHGALIVNTVLSDAELRNQWVTELSAMRDRINGMRELFVETMHGKTDARDFSFINHQRGMFSFSGLSRVQVDELRSKHSIYIVGSGRINVAGMTPANMERLCSAVAEVLN